MIEIKGCTRCGGDEVEEELHGEAELVCLQCGHRRDAPARPVSLATRRPWTREKAAA